MEFHQLATTALASLNKEKKRTEENKFKLSERLLLQTFLDQTETSLKKYAHLNFYAGTGSEKVLVFAEFHTDAVGDNEPDEWGLSSCKLLRKNYHRGTASSWLLAAVARSCAESPWTPLLLPQRQISRRPSASAVPSPSPWRAPRDGERGS
uniref:Uncharacterized protein n=1 Tax=Oryza meridionalis TaxID=40149 RepID=A0A0E0CTZ7_9ORYZ